MLCQQGNECGPKGQDNLAHGLPWAVFRRTRAKFRPISFFTRPSSSWQTRLDLQPRTIGIATHPDERAHLAGECDAGSPGSDGASPYLRQPPIILETPTGSNPGWSAKNSDALSRRRTGSSFPQRASSATNRRLCSNRCPAVWGGSLTVADDRRTI